MLKKLTASLIALSLVFIISGCGTKTGPVAIVNGVEISREVFNAELEYDLKMYESQGFQLTKDDIEYIKELIVDRLINTALLMTAAEKAGITADTVDIDGELEFLIAEFDDEEDFEQALALEGYTRDQYIVMLAEYLVVQELLELELNLSTVTVSDDDVQEMIGLYMADYGDEDPDLDIQLLESYFAENLREDIINNLIGDYIQDLREESEIVYLDI